MYITPKRCPRCRYERRSTDTAPDWQCPSCEVAYNKAEEAAYVRPVVTPVARPTRRSGGILWFVIALVLLAAGGMYAMQDRQRERGAATRAATTQPEVVMYATTWCGYCARARAFFTEHGISYVELDIERDARAEQMNRLLGGGGIPTILVGKDGLVHGFDERALSRMLGPWMRAPIASSR
jgi:glutaredoxin